MKKPFFKNIFKAVVFAAVMSVAIYIYIEDFQHMYAKFIAHQTIAEQSSSTDKITRLPSFEDKAPTPPMPPQPIETSAPKAPIETPPAPPEQPVTPSPTPASGSLSYMGWIPYWDQTRAIASFKAHTELFDHVGVFWYYIDESGHIQKYTYATEDAELISYAKNNDVNVLAIITNLPEKGDWDWERVDSVIASPKAQADHIAALVDLVEEHNFDGINLDYEAMRGSQKENFTSFVHVLADTLHSKGKILGISVHPKTGEGKPWETNGSQAQDYYQLATHADHIYVMTYDQHYNGSKPGPVASLPWVEQVMRYALEGTQIPSEKLFMGVPLYGYDWKQGKKKAKGLFYEEIVALIEKHNPQVMWDDESQSSYFEYENRVVWFDDAVSLERKLQLATEIGVGGAAVWRLGGEQPEVWDVLKKYR